MNLVLLLGQLGLTWDYQREPLFPIGTLYDPFVMRASRGHRLLGLLRLGRFILAGTPSGVSLSREGGAHQSTITPGIGIETPKLAYAEPCFARELEWLLLDALARLHAPDGEALYLRLSTTPMDQAPFGPRSSAAARSGCGRTMLAGALRLLAEPGAGDDRIMIAACGAIVPQALAAAAALAEEEGVAATVICVSSPEPPLPQLAAGPRGAGDGRPRRGAVASRAPARAGARRSARDGDRRRVARPGLARRRARLADGAARRRRLRADGQPAPALRGARDRAQDAIVTAALAALEPTG